MADLANRCFTLRDQQAFAQLSGDTNLLHSDPVAARRTPAGAVTVHGMAAVLWALESLRSSGFPLEDINFIRIRFVRFMYLNRALRLHMLSDDKRTARFEILENDEPLVAITLRYGVRHPNPAPLGTPPLAVRNTPLELEPADIDGFRGWIAPNASEDEFERYYPELAATLGVRRLQALSLLSYLSGMVCPGLYSTTTRIELQIHNAVDGRSGVGFSAALEAVYNLANLSIQGSGISGTVFSLIRAAPVEYPRLDDVKRLVSPHEFEHVSALVIGGSRGLGASTATILAAGGARVYITFLVGEGEARALASDINANCGSDRCSFLQLDVSNLSLEALSRLPMQVNQLYYFATPPMAPEVSGSYSRGRLLKFCDVFIDGFSRIFIHLLDRGLRAAFYPGCEIYTLEPFGIFEYKVAKEGAALICKDLARKNPSVRIRVVQLPKTLTDQTSSATKHHLADPLRVMLPEVRALAY